MREKTEVGVIGLGKFGLHFGITLTELGHTVIGLDTDAGRTRAAQEHLTQVYQADATDKAALVQLGFQHLDTVAVSVGGSMETSILATLNLQELGVRTIIAKATSPAHRKVLERIGAHQVIQPEADVARHTAYKLSNPGLLDFLPIGEGVMIQERTVDAWAGKTLVDLNLRNESDVLVAAVCHGQGEEYRFVPNPVIPFNKGDKLLLIGNRTAITALVT